MAKKSKTRRKGSRQQARQRQTRRQQRRRQRFLLGGVLLALVIGIGVGLQVWQRSRTLPQLPGAVEGHYTRGATGAPVVVKEFSDYT